MAGAVQVAAHSDLDSKKFLVKLGHPVHEKELFMDFAKALTFFEFLASVAQGQTPAVAGVPNSLPSLTAVSAARY